MKKVAENDGKVLSTSKKVAFTAVIFLVYFSFGSAETVIATGMIDLVAQVKTNVADFSSTALVANAVTYCISAIIGGWLSKFVNRQLYLVISILAAAAAKVWIPFTTTLLELTACQALAGFAGAGIDVANNAWMLSIWREGSGPLMQALHFCFALGTSVSPVFTEPFLSGDESVIFWNETSMAMENSTVINQSQLHVPLFGCGALYIVCVALFAILHLITPYDEKNEQLQMSDDADMCASSFGRRLHNIILATVAMILCFDLGSEMSTLNYSNVFVVKSGFNKHKGAFISSARAICFCASRAVAAVVAIKLPIRIILYFSIFTNVTGNLMILYSTSLSSGSDLKEVMLWIGFCFMGFGFGPTYPAMLSFVETYIRLTTFICGLFVCAGSVSTVLNFLVVGKFIEEYVSVLTYFNLASMTGVTVLFIFLDIIVKRSTIQKYHVNKIS